MKTILAYFIYWGWIFLIYVPIRTPFVIASNLFGWLEGKCDSICWHLDKWLQMNPRLKSWLIKLLKETSL